MSKFDPWAFPNPYPAFSSEALEYSERKLAHYNKWLLDNKRPIGTPYPGFPEDIERARATVKEKKAAEPVGEKPVKGKRPSKPAKVARTGSKLEQAIAIYRRSNGEKASTIAAIQHECGMSVAGATTYYYNARKAVKS